MWLLRHQQALYDLAVDQVLLDDLGDIFDGDTAIPDLLGIHDNRHTVLALIETSRVVGADRLRQSAGLELGLEAVAHVDPTLVLAGPAGMIRCALVDAHEHVTREARHPIARLTRKSHSDLRRESRRLDAWSGLAHPSSSLSAL
jgi:hypothetical protein